jgi:RNAse (barnase) inhibitor barstar
VSEIKGRVCNYNGHMWDVLFHRITLTFEVSFRNFANLLLFEEERTGSLISVIRVKTSNHRLRRRGLLPGSLSRLFHGVCSGI